METIENYIDNMFASLPKTEEMKALRDEILANMEEKYYELLQDGKTENEAIGIVIAEFGNIDEIMEAYDISREQKQESKKSLSEEEVDAFLQSNRIAAKWIGLGTLLCILGSALIVLFTGFTEFGYMGTGIALTIGISFFLLVVALAVGLFIYAGMKMNKWKYVYQQIDVELPRYLKDKIAAKKQKEHPKFVTAIIVAVVLIILSPSILLITILINESMVIFGVVILLTIVAFAIHILIYFGMSRSAYSKLLEKPLLDRKTAQKHNRFDDAIATILMPLAVIVFLISGFIYDMWRINWIVFPIAALLIAIFSGSYSLFSKHRS
ncbi:permease prefix domain 1-containing protein [Gracilibacillus massiliensis]|uniref:permease prefix domain 1-containing protein n=1 Tax=Gracilibacillus massiliensis TaxID=1564956 RepID=UPI00071D18B7|nr:permease prefix domain 1-containing protein [Gracilibacillus massiliensis]